MATSRRASSMGVRGKTLAACGRTHGRVAVEKKVPAKNIMGKATALPIPEAAAGLRAQADKINPIFKNTMVPNSAIKKIHAALP